MSDESFVNTLNLNLVSVFYALKYEIPAIREAGGGSIINTASTAGVQGVGQGISAYVAAKHGVIGLTRAAALEAARDQIRVNAIVPGPIATESWQARVGQIPGLVERIATFIPLGRVGVSIYGQKGPSAFAETIQALRQGFPDIQWTIEDLVAAGDRVAVRWTWQGTHTGSLRGIPASQKQVTDKAIAIYQFKDHKIVQAWIETDRLGLLQQIGVVPQDLGYVHTIVYNK